ncbi:alpha-amylase family glycosyl hydrolase [Paenisporosarcina cavernae]|uniref:Glycosyl hydrolase family 13 catalytic domain-containing protein n=1 Tax=Paenisporosarcina cavernae TaxID=2320858 RepID=A0A385YSN3_9BACL|nr:alpha-amylase family glycosyl hydrolase [Paenisporosarcina cavernae]AYC28997.1 hypothetical protein D3873_03590 [Paenisporosarcina cavernae]
MKKTTLLACTLLAVIVLQTPAAANELNENLSTESVYDLLVDRFNDANPQNNVDVNTQDPSKFFGGDFQGVTDKLSYIQDMGFTAVSIGPVFETDTYNGSNITNYGELEPRFGTDEQFEQLLDAAHTKNMAIIVDLPLAGVTTENLDNVISAYSAFLAKYDIDGVRVTLANEEQKPLREEVVAAIQQSSRVSIFPVSDTVSTWQDAFRTVDLPLAQWAKVATNPEAVQAIDTLTSERFTAQSAEENMFPPTRIKVALGAMMALPGIPTMTYGTEIAMNGKTEAESHQYMNFKTEEEIIDYLTKIQKLRGQSEALQTGNIDILHEEDGFVVLKRWNDEETWIVVINNSSETKKYTVSSEDIGEKKELRGMFESDIIRSQDNGKYPVVLDRELVEFFYVEDRRGLNTGYLVALAGVYVLFMVFIYLVWKKGKNRTKESR